MSRNVYFPFGARVVRDTYVNQSSTPQEEPKKEEPKVEVKMSGEPSLEILNEEPKPTRKKSAPKTEETNEES